LLAFGWFVSVPFGAIFSYAVLLSGRLTSGRELSLINFIANLGALAFPPVVGYALDVTGSFAVGFGSLAAVSLAGTIALAAWLPAPGAEAAD
jgi:fucose permease